MLSLSLINNKADQKQQEKLFKIAENLIKTTSVTSTESATDQETKTKTKQMNSSTSSTPTTTSSASSSFRIDDILIKNSDIYQEKKSDDQNASLPQAPLNYSNNLMSTLSSLYDMSCYLPPSMNPLLNKSSHPNSQQFMPLIYNSNIISIFFYLNNL